ncbi:MAG: CoA transferase [Bacillota bacterium]
MTEDRVLRRPLEGVRVLAVEQYIAGPYCTMLLADAGAEVIKVERPGTGDPRRTIGPFVQTQDGQKVSGGFLEYNRSKKSLTLNMADEQGKAIFRALVSQVDVVVENLRPGAMDRLGLGYRQLAELNPRIIYASITGFGQLEGYRGPYWQWPALDIVVEAMGGIMHMVGYEDRPPLSTFYGMADVYSGLVNAYGIMLALYDREITGRGQWVDTSMYDCMVAFNERSVALHSLTGEVPCRGRERVLGPRGAYLAADGYVAINIPTDDMWKRLATVLGREDLVEDERTRTGPARAQNDALVRVAIESWLEGRTRASAIAALIEAGVPAGPVQTAEDLASCPQAEARRMLLEVPEPGLPGLRLARTAARLSHAPEVTAARAPRLGEHTAEILGSWLGYGPADIQALRAAQVV